MVTGNHLKEKMISDNVVNIHETFGGAKDCAHMLASIDFYQLRMHRSATVGLILMFGCCAIFSTSLIFTSLVVNVTLVPGKLLERFAFHSSKFWNPGGFYTAFTEQDFSLLKVQVHT